MLKSHVKIENLKWSLTMNSFQTLIVLKKFNIEMIILKIITIINKYVWLSHLQNILNSTKTINMWFFGPRTIIAIGFSHGISKPRITTNTSYGISKPKTTCATNFSLAKTPSTTSPPSLTRIIESTTIRCWSPSRRTSCTQQKS